MLSNYAQRLVQALGVFFILLARLVRFHFGTQFQQLRLLEQHLPPLRHFQTARYLLDRLVRIPLTQARFGSHGT